MEENKNQFVEDLQVGDKIKSTFLVVKKVKRVDKNDKPFYDLELQDKTGKIPGKIWSDSIPNIKDFRKKDIVFIIGEVKNDYGKQIIIKNLKKIEAENIDYSKYDFKVRKADNELLDNLINDLLKTNATSDSSEFFKEALNIAKYHHEYWDGSGYPEGLKADEIPLSARVMAIVDVFDALSNKRVYKEAWSIDKTMHYIKSQSGTQFDPDVVNAFLLEQDAIRKTWESSRN